MPSATVKCKDCLSLRHLLSNILVACMKSTGQLDALEQYDRVENLNGLAVSLQKLLEGYHQQLVLVLDGIDRQRGSSPTLLPALARLGDTVHQLPTCFCNPLAKCTDCLSRCRISPSYS